MMPDLDGFTVCERLKANEATRDVPVIFLTALNETPEKVRAFATGGVDYLTKPFEPRELLARVGTHLALRRAQREVEDQNARLREEIEAHQRSRGVIRCLEDEIRTGHDFREIVGRSPSLTRLLDQLALVAATESTVLVLGETGTGKELVARAIHDRSPRRERPLVKVNCAALPRELIESELFGHEKGAFTGATQQRRGPLRARRRRHALPRRDRRAAARGAGEAAPRAAGAASSSASAARAPCAADVRG